jgi:hypothetical protein
MVTPHYVNNVSVTERPRSRVMEKLIVAQLDKKRRSFMKPKMPLSLPC